MAHSFAAVAFLRTDATLRFEIDADGAPTDPTMKLGGVDYPAARTDAAD